MFFPLMIVLEIYLTLEFLDNHEWKLLVNFVAVLKHVEDITEQLSGEKKR